MNRRSFIKNTAFASAAMFTPQFLMSAGRLLQTENNTGRVLVIVQLSGGNDGLNTIIPYEDDYYYKMRPGLALNKEDIIPLHDHFGFHKSLAPLRELFDQGSLSIFNRIGYPNPDRSHFRSMDIWHTASDANEFRTEGWIGRYLDASCGGCATPHLAIELDESLSLALKGRNTNGLAVSSPERMKKAMSGPLMQDLMNEVHEGNSNLSFLYKTLTDAGKSVEYLFEHARRRTVSTDFPSGGFANDLKLIASLINNGSETKVYYVSLTGFDTHNNQKNRQGRLLTEYAEAIQAFYRELKHSGNWHRTLVMTFSEFGRRVEQNASGGTDHGKANCLFLAGGGLRYPGFQPVNLDLRNTEEGDLTFKTDFRSVYAAVLNSWLDIDPVEIIGRPFEPVLI